MKNESAAALGKLSVKKHPHLHTKERMKALSEKGVKARKAKRTLGKKKKNPLDMFFTID